MKKGLFLLFVLLVFGSSDCFSQSDRWVLVYEDNEIKYYYDTETIKTIINMPPPPELNYEISKRVFLRYENIDSDFEYSIIEMEFFCERNEVTKLYEAQYRKNGKILREDNKVVNYTKIIPDTMLEILFNYFCKN